MRSPRREYQQMQLRCDAMRDCLIAFQSNLLSEHRPACEQCARASTCAYISEHALPPPNKLLLSITTYYYLIITTTNFFLNNHILLCSQDITFCPKESGSHRFHRFHPFLAKYRQNDRNLFRSFAYTWFFFFQSVNNIK